MTKEWQEASTQMAIDQKMDPFTGPTSEGYKGEHPTHVSFSETGPAVLTRAASFPSRQGLRPAVKLPLMVAVWGEERCGVCAGREERCGGSQAVCGPVQSLKTTLCLLDTAVTEVYRELETR